jgi:hypothetical protein
LPIKLKMYNPNNDGPVSPMKRLRILTEKQNVTSPSKEVTSPLKPIKETAPVVVQKTPDLSDQEPLLQETSNQYVIFPINHDDMWHMYKELVGNFWSVTETLENLDSLNLDYNEKKVIIFCVTANKRRRKKKVEFKI